MKAVILIGHGGIPSGFSSQKISRLKALEAKRQREKTPMCEEEKVLDEEVRSFKRTEENDPFYFGTFKIAQNLRAKIAKDIQLEIAFNEFCSPSIEESTAKLVNAGYNDITFLSTMFTRGGVHSEFEIPEILDSLRKQYPAAKLSYAWPFEENLISDFLTKQLEPVLS